LEKTNVEASHSIKLAAEIVAAYVSNNPIPTSELPALIEAVQIAVRKLATPSESVLSHVEAKAPAVPVRKSVTPDYVICLEDGKKFKSMRRHLTRLGLTPQQYREKWNLPSDYPMVAPNYAAQRSAMAIKIGLGQLRRKPGEGVRRPM
jgi:predicted transcriptional regulator